MTYSPIDPWPPAYPGLDVERLARALEASGMLQREWKEQRGAPWPSVSPYTWAAAIDRAYRELSPAVIRLTDDGFYDDYDETVPETGYYDEPPRRIPAALLLLALLVAVGVIGWMVRR